MKFRQNHLQDCLKVYYDTLKPYLDFSSTFEDFMADPVSGMKEFATGLGLNKMLKQVSFEDSIFTSLESFEILMKGIKANSSITDLSLKSCKLERIHAYVIADALLDHPSIVRLE